jgi:hypothetical protein
MEPTKPINWETEIMIRKAQKWDTGVFFSLDAFEFRSASNTAWLRFQNGETCEVPVRHLWRGRSGKPDWERAHIHPEISDVLLVPTVPGHPAVEGLVAEIPSDVIRKLTDAEYRKYVEGLAADRRIRQ